MSGGLGRSGPVEMVVLPGEGVLHSWNSRSKGLEDSSMEPDCHLRDTKSGTPIPKRRDVEVRTFDVASGSESLKESRCCGLDHAPS